MMKIALRALLIPSFFLLIACQDNAIFEENHALADASWNTDEPVQFQFAVDDTVSRYDLFINLRNGDAYPYMNLFLFVKMNFPNGRTALDTVECFLADPTGKWLGSGIGDVYDNRFLFKKNRSFPVPGTYKIEIRQAMRVDDLPDVYDVGLRIAPAAN